MGTTITPNMSLTVPIAGNEPGPQYALDINNCMSIIDNHDHTAGSGVLITPTAINYNNDLPANNNRLTSVKSVTFIAQTVPLPAAAPDLLALSTSGADLYYNDGNGNQIRITQSGGIAGTPGSITGLVPPASVTYVPLDSTFVFQSAANTPANLDAASITLRNLTANSKGLTINPPNAMAADYSIVMPALPANTSFLQIDSSGNETATIPISQGIDVANLSPDVVASLTPTGSITMYGGAAAPTGYLMCDGSSVLRSSYAALFAVIGTAFGAADGTHFNVPDMRGYFPRGVDNGAGHDPDASSRTALQTGGNTGDAVGSYQADQNLAHTHNINEPAVINPYIGVYAGLTSNPKLSVILAGGNQYNDTSGALVQQQGMSSSGGNQSNPRNVYVNFIIKT